MTSRGGGTTRRMGAPAPAAVAPARSPGMGGGLRGGASRAPASLGGCYNPFAGSQAPSGQQYSRTARTGLPMQPHLRESYGVDPYGREYVASSEEHPGYVDPTERYRIDAMRSTREGEAPAFRSIMSP